MSYNYPQIVPHLVEDINLKRARVETEEGDAIRVTGINCGDKVTIVPTLTEGTKIADFTINNVDGELYAPEVPTPPVTEVSITPSVTTGTKIADFSINEVAGELYAPASQGVGEAYPGSTGGEIFNYYGTDSNANTASGNYSTTFGYNNKNTAPYFFISGSNNTTTGTNTSSKGGLIAGYNNTVDYVNDVAICLGENNRVYGNKQIFIGFDNMAMNSISPKSICIGRGLTVDFADLNQKVVLGTYNAQTATLSSEKGKLQTLIGGGDSEYAGHRRNAIEVYSGLNETYSSCTLFPEEIALSNYTTSNKAYVNAITPPQDPQNMTSDDKTLVTKSHLGTTLPMNHLSSAITGIDESSFPLDFTSYWTAARATDANMRISLRINGSCYSQSIYNCLAVDSSFECNRSAYDSGTQTTTFSRYRFGWDYANKTLTLTGSMSWEMSDAGAISNVTHGLTGLVITIYQIETY